MSEMINIGIDLGTTNSLIAQAGGGGVEVFKNPRDLGPVLPSVVGFRKARTLVGQQARSYAEKDPNSVVSCFKRKMGTSESFRIPSLDDTRTPVELSAIVLKELRGFPRSETPPEAAVITIPASFDTLQSNATKEAGIQAGFKQVVLLQEPIAASLAFANRQGQIWTEGKHWIVYDLGGGTFDVALVKTAHGELTVVDNEGDNYFGGSDFDALIVEHLLVPHLEKTGAFEDLAAALKSASGRHNTLWHKLLHVAERAKIDLSSTTSTDIELDGIVDDSEEKHDVLVTVTRSEFEALIKPKINSSIELIQRILTRNNLQDGDLDFVLMIGGSTYVPYVRTHVEERLGVPTNTDVDPVNAVVVGAAHFAACREMDRGAALGEPSTGSKAPICVKKAYSPTSHETSELFAAKIEGDVTGLDYRITRHDGGYDSGLRPLTERISEDLPLEKDAYNSFTFQIVDKQGQPIDHEAKKIQIAHGKYSVTGQVVPMDICLVLDDLTQERTQLASLFLKNTVLPARAKQTVTVNRTVRRGEHGELLQIVVVEGPADSLPEATQSLGHLIVRGSQLSGDVPKGTDVELTVELSESRDLTVRAHVNATDQVFEDVFAPDQRHVEAETLSDLVRVLEHRVASARQEADGSENYELAQSLKRLGQATRELGDQTTRLVFDDVTDDRYKLDDQRSKLARELDELTRDQDLERLRMEYREAKQDCNEILTTYGNDHDRRVFEDTVRQETGVLSSNNSQKLQHAIRSLSTLRFSMLRRSPEFLGQLLQGLYEQRARFNDQTSAQSLFETAQTAFQRGDYERVDETIRALMQLLPQDEKDQVERTFTGLSAG